MYTAVPWEADITRVYVLRPMGISSSTGISLFSMKKGDILCVADRVEAECVCTCLCLCGYVSSVVVHLSE